MEIISMISLIAAGAISGLVLIVGIIYLCILRTDKKRPVIRPKAR